MTIPELIQAAIASTFATEARDGVMAALQSIPSEFSDPLRTRPSAEFLQQAVLVLAWGNLDIFNGLIMNAQMEPRDVIYVIQSPYHVSPDLTCDELIRRYEQLGFPVPDLLQ